MPLAHGRSRRLTGANRSCQVTWGNCPHRCPGRCRGRWGGRGGGGCGCAGSRGSSWRRVRACRTGGRNGAPARPAGRPGCGAGGWGNVGRGRAGRLLPLAGAGAEHQAVLSPPKPATRLGLGSRGCHIRAIAPDLSLGHGGRRLLWRCWQGTRGPAVPREPPATLRQPSPFPGWPQLGVPSDRPARRGRPQGPSPRWGQQRVSGGCMAPPGHLHHASTPAPSPTVSTSPGSVQEKSGVRRGLQG